MPDEDPILEIVVSLSKTGKEPTAMANGDAGRSNYEIAEDFVANAKTTPMPQAKAQESAATIVAKGPSVSIRDNGCSVTVAKTESTSANPIGDGPCRFDLVLPQRVVPDSAKSYFWEGDLTIRAVLAVE